MTLPQIYILSHAAWVNSERMDARIKAKQKKGGHSHELEPDLTKQDSDAWAKYYTF